MVTLFTKMKNPYERVLMTNDDLEGSEVNRTDERPEKRWTASGIIDVFRNMKHDFTGLKNKIFGHTRLRDADRRIFNQNVSDYPFLKCQCEVNSERNLRAPMDGAFFFVIPSEVIA